MLFFPIEKEKKHFIASDELFNGFTANGVISSISKSLLTIEKVNVVCVTINPDVKGLVTDKHLLLHFASAADAPPPHRQ